MAGRISADLFVSEMLELVREHGGSQGVNLREVARRVGCAHTNAYNYFASFDDLFWAAFRRALVHYGEYFTHDLDDSLERPEYLRRLISNLATYPQVEPGLYRFIGSDPIDLASVPPDVLESVGRMKQWAFDALRVCVPDLGDSDEAEATCNVVLAYVDGETLNLINGRTVADEDIRGRVVRNALRLLEGDGERQAVLDGVPTYPRLDLDIERRAARGG